MTFRSRKGAVLALVVVTVLVLLVLGIGILLMVMQLGGGQELQHATDAGNLNVAKQALRRPGTELLLGDEANQFQDLIDPDTGEVNLQTYNRLVAHCFLVSANAQSLGTAAARQHAQQLVNLVSGIAERLNNELVSSGNFDGHFHNVAQNHAMRMFKAVSNPVSHIGERHNTSLMARGKATNVSVLAAQMLPGSPDLGSFIVQGPDGMNYLSGYTMLAGTGNSSLWGVPVRPGEPPHLVSHKTFRQESNRGPIPEFVPPNAFQSGASAVDQIASGMSNSSSSTAIVGSLRARYNAQIPRGVIVVDNTGVLNGTQITGAYDIWQDKLMSPNYIEVLGGSADGLIADQSAGNSPTLQDVKEFVRQNQTGLIDGNPQLQQQLTQMLSQAGVDSWGRFPANPGQNAGNPDFIRFIAQNGIAKCSNGVPANQHAEPGTQGTGAGREPCNLERFLDVYDTRAGGSTGITPVGNLMAVEKFHLDICEKRASGVECANIVASAENTGLKLYSDRDCGLTQVRLGTLEELFNQTRVNNQTRQNIRVLMNQMKPGVSNEEINAVFGTIVPFGTVSYIYRNPQSENLVLSASVPPWALPDLSQGEQQLPDGTPVTFTRADNPFKLDHVTNCDGECGYPHPWDCPLDSQAVGQDTTIWTPSSGWRNILGVVKFINRANGGGRFCCPC